MRTAIALLVLAFAASVSGAHYNMLLPDKPWANKDEKVTFTYQFGHPYEHELFDAPKPVALVLITPKGKKETIDIDKALTKIELPAADGKKVAAWQFTFTPKERGDHTFALKTPRTKIAEKEFVEDTVRVVLHVQTQNGWDTEEAPFDGYEILPYTRPYGLLPNMVFRGRLGVVRKGKRGGSSGGSAESPPSWAIEVEKYNPKPPKNLPPDELITFKLKTDANGFFSATLPETGWWGVTGITEWSGEEKGTVVFLRATMWIHVDEKK